MDYSDEEIAAIIGDSFKDLNYKERGYFLLSVSKNPDDQQKYSKLLLKMLGGRLYNFIEENFCDQEYRANLFDNLDKKGVSCIVLGTDKYPPLLAKIDKPPRVLYCKGDTSLLKGDMFAIVGSRKTNNQITALAKTCAKQLAKKFVIVSGVADGAESAVIDGGLEGGKMVCVLPCGLDCPYPSANAERLRRVEQEGLVVSEFPMEMATHKFNFDTRNRMIAGLSRGVLVVSAGKKSGALATANHTFELHRDIFAFPYNIGLATGAGCNDLIRSGANLCEGAGDILERYGMTVEDDAPNLTSDEQRILDVLHNQGELHAEKLAQAVGKKPFEIVPLCSSLEIKGLVVKTGGNKFSAVK